MFFCALVERDVAAAEAALIALGDNPFGYDEMLFGAKFNEGIVARLAKDEKKARAAFGHEQQEKVVQAQPNLVRQFACSACRCRAWTQKGRSAKK